MRIKKSQSPIERKRTYDQSKEDFELCKKTVLRLLDDLLVEYEDFTNDISPTKWRTTGHHITQLKQIREDIEEFIPISIEEKDLDWVKNSRFDGKGEGPGKWKTQASPTSGRTYAMGEKINNKYLMKIKTFESFNSPSLDIKDLKEGDTILYQGSRYDIMSSDEYTIKASSVATGKEIYINQEQLNSSNVKLISSRVIKE